MPLQVAGLAPAANSRLMQPGAWRGRGPQGAGGVGGGRGRGRARMVAHAAVVHAVHVCGVGGWGVGWGAVHKGRAPVASRQGPGDLPGIEGVLRLGPCTCPSHPAWQSRTNAGRGKTWSARRRRKHLSSTTCRTWHTLRCTAGRARLPCRWWSHPHLVGNAVVEGGVAVRVRGAGVCPAWRRVAHSPDASSSIRPTGRAGAHRKKGWGIG